MVRLGEDGMLGIPQRHVLEFLRRFDHAKPLPKKVHELLIGYILLQFVNEEQRESAVIGFPAAEGWEKHCPEGPLTLDWLFEHHYVLVNDTDVDIQISCGGMTTKYQITRFVHPIDQSAHRKLSHLIEWKCRHEQPDPFLHLLVSIERTPNMSEDELRSLVTKTSIPFAAIILIMKASADRGHFSFCQLYPKPILGKEIRVSLPV